MAPPPVGCVGRLTDYRWTAALKTGDAGQHAITPRITRTGTRVADRTELTSWAYPLLACTRPGVSPWWRHWAWCPKCGPFNVFTPEDPDDCNNQLSYRASLGGGTSLTGGVSIELASGHPEFDAGFASTAADGGIGGDEAEGGGSRVPG